MEVNAQGPAEILNGWKEVATYLRMGVRTAQRYEKFGLPVRRPAGKQRGSVIATKAEVHAWISARPIRDMHRLSGPSPALVHLRAGITEMKRLREEMSRLRAEAVASLISLHGKLRFMPGAEWDNLVSFPRAQTVEQIGPLQAGALGYNQQKAS